MATILKSSKPKTTNAPSAPKLSTSEQQSKGYAYDIYTGKKLGSSATSVRDKSGKVVPIAPGEDVETATAKAKGLPMPKAPELNPQPQTPQTPQINTSQPTPGQTPVGVINQPAPIVPQAPSIPTAPSDMSSRYKEGLNQVQNTPAPVSEASARTTISKVTPGTSYTPPPAIQTEVDTTLKTYADAIAEFLHPEKQRKTLVQEYEGLSKSLGIKGLQSELLDINRIMDGSEDDIRSEVTAAGGFATESQVQAMTIGRNKSLLKKAQYISDQLTAAKDQLQTLSQLNVQDRQFADQRMQTGIQLLGNLVQMKQTMQKAAQDNYRWYAEKAGLDNLYASTGGDPFNVSMVEKTLGLPPGGLHTAAVQAQQDRNRATEKENLQLDVLRSNLATDKAQRANIQSQIDERNQANAPGEIPEKVIGKIQSSPEYKTINGVLPAIQALKSYKNAIDSYGTTEQFSGTGKGELAGTYGNALATWKSLAGLGALSGADFTLAENAVPETGFFKRSSTMKSKLDSSIDIAVKQAETLTKRLQANYPQAKDLLERQLDEAKVIAYPDKFKVGQDGNIYELTDVK